MINLEKIKAVPKTGNEILSYDGNELKYNLLDFWRWSCSDILSNTARGRFAEFVVGSVIGLIPENINDGWGAYDLTSEKGIKIEVKSAAYIQSWNQKKYSTISFSIKPAKYFDPKIGELCGELKRHADIYVFCLLNHKDQSTIDPLKMEQWEFYVLPTFQLDNYERSQTSITLNSLKKMIQSIEYKNLKDEIEKAFEEQRKSVIGN